MTEQFHWDATKSTLIPVDTDVMQGILSLNKFCLKYGHNDTEKESYQLWIWIAKNFWAFCNIANI